MTTTQTETILSDTEIALLNDARSLLYMLSKRSGVRAWNARTDLATNYWRVSALAGYAEQAIFETLNWIDAYKIQPLTEDQLHRKPEVQS